MTSQILDDLSGSSDSEGKCISWLALFKITFLHSHKLDVSEGLVILTKEAGSQSRGRTRAVVKGHDGETASKPVAPRRVEGTACIL